MEYIERDVAIKAVCDSKPHTCQLNDCGESCQEVSVIKAIPVADVRPVVRGKWKTYNNTYVCSACGRPVSFWQSNFCPNCGADMRVLI